MTGLPPPFNLMTSTEQESATGQPLSFRSQQSSHAVLSMLLMTIFGKPPCLVGKLWQGADETELRVYHTFFALVKLASLTKRPVLGYTGIIVPEVAAGHAVRYPFWMECVILGILSSGGDGTMQLVPASARRQHHNEEDFG